MLGRAVEEQVDVVQARPPGGSQIRALPTQMGSRQWAGDGAPGPTAAAMSTPKGSTESSTLGFVRRRHLPGRRRCDPRPSSRQQDRQRLRQDTSRARRGARVERDRGVGLPALRRDHHRCHPAPRGRRRRGACLGGGIFRGSMNHTCRGLGRAAMSQLLQSLEESVRSGAQPVTGSDTVVRARRRLRFGRRSPWLSHSRGSGSSSR